MREAPVLYRRYLDVALAHSLVEAPWRRPLWSIRRHGAGR
jgi:hypothetical protein